MKQSEHWLPGRIKRNFIHLVGISHAYFIKDKAENKPSEGNGSGYLE
jgi:hypothetical protein